MLDRALPRTLSVLLDRGHFVWEGPGGRLGGRHFSMPDFRRLNCHRYLTAMPISDEFLIAAIK
jgi:hypothetical protein